VIQRGRGGDGQKLYGEDRGGEERKASKEVERKAKDSMRGGGEKDGTRKRRRKRGV
jgi:hypothetical protein